MENQHSYVLGAFLVGIGATLILDLWSLLLSRVFRVTAPDFCIVGRWILYMPNGTFVHHNITAAPAKQAECATGWVFHYVTGVVFASMLVLPGAGRWLDAPTFHLAMIVGIATVAFPFFLMQPSLGFGIAAAKTPDPTKARIKSLMTHAVFGVGLYLSALAVGYIQRAGF